ncbi:protein of unknown function [Bradyrhizobium vignae]|uniref:Uncharacterized protein n=1 Tax=Bradyrhizobium vignae TaxID=1549949 RepID=A0A2U3Q0N5_9BRAD|nr:protein of unknown function [Bradyrhizobium vignae]
MRPMACNLLHFSVTHSWHGYFCSARAVAVNHARAAPFGLRGLTATAEPSKWPSMPRMHKSASPSGRRGRGGDISDGPRTERVVAFHGIHTSRRTKAESVTHVPGTFCHLCLGPLKQNHPRSSAFSQLKRA